MAEPSTPEQNPQRLLRSRILGDNVWSLAYAVAERLTYIGLSFNLLQLRRWVYVSNNRLPGIRATRLVRGFRFARRFNSW